MDGVVRLRPLRADDGPELRRIHATPEVRHWWGEPEADFPEHDDPESTRFAIDVDGAVIGMIQYGEELEARYRSAAIDIFIDPACQRRGIGTEALRQCVQLLISERGHHRITIDPALANAAAIRSYEKVGFRPVGVMRGYERDVDGPVWHHALLMEYVVDSALEP